MFRFETFSRMSLSCRLDTIFLIMRTNGEHFYATCQVMAKLNPEIIYFDTDCLVVSPIEYHRMKYLLEKYKKEGSVYVDNDIYKSRN